MKNNMGAIEALLFVVANEGLSIDELSKQLDITHNDVIETLKAIEEKYKQDNSGIHMIQTANRIKLATKKEYAPIIENYAQSEIATKLSQAALEILAIIAYKQPVTRLDIEDIRGVQSTGPLHKLIMYDLIEEAGRLDLPGKPIIYRTTDYFLDYFGLVDIDDLPKINEEVIENNEARDLFFESFQLTIEDIVD